VHSPAATEARPRTVTSAVICGFPAAAADTALGSSTARHTAAAARRAVAPRRLSMVGGSALQQQLEGGMGIQPHPPEASWVSCLAFTWVSHSGSCECMQHVLPGGESGEACVSLASARRRGPAARWPAGTGCPQRPTNQQFRFQDDIHNVSAPARQGAQPLAGLVGVRTFRRKASLITCWASLLSLWACPACRAASCKATCTQAAQSIVVVAQAWLPGGCQSLMAACCRHICAALRKQ